MAGYNRAPNNTDRILQETGSGFAIGALGSIPYHFFKGVRTMPRGSRISGSFDYVRMRAPRTAGSFAVWMSLFSAVDCAAAYLRHKEDPWNTIVAGASASAILALRQGTGPAMKAAVTSGLLMALGEGLMLFNEREGPELNNANKGHVPVPIPVPIPVQEEASSSSGFFQTWFGSGKKDDGSSYILEGR
ncbi:mitochondrial import inner membrane translocase subunit TIM17-1-like [Chenopodium quinoa]|uniref:mitochondrial import inner membrane translocase subunit TIM17-1-like n=1 Tax=Chenopodium quinoa TaxID=63459 RepID=UPI000B780743|nr:mitochondrial import inner membrane translocase subunit TIM17-1-like [Chenopodium quinoa]